MNHHLQLRMLPLEQNRFSEPSRRGQWMLNGHVVCETKPPSLIVETLTLHYMWNALPPPFYITRSSSVVQAAECGGMAQVTLPPWPSQCAGIIGLSYCAQPRMTFGNSSFKKTHSSSIPGDSRQRNHTGRQRDSFGRRGCFAAAPAQRFPVRSIRDGRARLVPSPQGKQQLEALRTESFTASTANPGRSGSVGKGRPPKDN
ncbi:hypothetical protein AAY473_001360 [Plecturocebus cupreus]